MGGPRIYNLNFIIYELKLDFIYIICLHMICIFSLIILNIELFDINISFL